MAHILSFLSTFDPFNYRYRITIVATSTFTFLPFYITFSLYFLTSTALPHTSPLPFPPHVFNHHPAALSKKNSHQNSMSPNHSLSKHDLPYIILCYTTSIHRTRLQTHALLTYFTSYFTSHYSLHISYIIKQGRYTS